MLNPHDKRNAIRRLLEMERVTREGTDINSGEIGDGYFTDHEQRARIRDGRIEIDNISFTRLLDCGCVAQIQEIVSTCDICGRRVCSSCSSLCSKCNLRCCRYCFRVYQDNGHSIKLCGTCHASERRASLARGLSSGIFRFFVEKED